MKTESNVHYIARLTITLLLPRLDRWLLPLTQGRGKELRS
mgnify:CR=1 FL=1